MATWVIAVRGAAPPMLFARREPDDVTRANFLDRSSPTLHPAAAAGHDERLAQRVRVPRGAGAGLEGHTGTTRACRNRRFEQRVNTHGAHPRRVARKLPVGTEDQDARYHQRPTRAWI